MSEKVNQESTIELRPEVRRFAEAMEKVLRAYDYKGGWKTCDPTYLAGRMVEEAGEAVVALGDDMSMARRLAKVQKEAIDTANFAMMLWDVSQGEGE